MSSDDQGPQIHYHATSIDILTQLSEDDLQTRIIEPLFRAMKFTDVRRTAGPVERGRDLIAFKRDLGRPLLYAVQIKKFKFSGRSQTSSALIHLVNQLRQAICEEVIDPTINRRRQPDKCIFITPYAIDIFAFESCLNQLLDARHNQIDIVDGPRLLDLINEYIPEVLLALGDIDFQYRMHLAQAVNIIAESRAFNVRDDLHLTDIYVGVSILFTEAPVLLLLYRHPPLLSGSHVVTADVQSISSLTTACQGVANVSPAVQSPPPPIMVDLFTISGDDASNVSVHLYRSGSTAVPPPVLATFQKEKLVIKNDAKFVSLADGQTWCISDRNDNPYYWIRRDLRDMEERFTVSAKVPNPKAEHLLAMMPKGEQRHKSVYAISLDEVLQQMASRVIMTVDEVASLSSEETTSKRATQIITALRQLELDVQRFCNEPLIQREWIDIVDVKRERTNLATDCKIVASLLAKVKTPLIIRGAPGAGKTTLVRWLARTIAHESVAELPLVLQLSSTSVNAVRSIEKACYQEMNDSGYRVTEERFRKELQGGRYRIFFDGLDEKGRDAPIVFDAIQQFYNKYPTCSIVVTCRDAYQIAQWNAALSVKLSPFDDAQLAAFVGKWFASTPSYRDTISTWLNANPAMKDAARTPMIAALLCSLYAAGAEMPEREIELYDRRFELLIGDWERAKGLETVNRIVRTRYWHFLMHLALQLHKKRARSVRTGRVIEVASGFYCPDFHRRAESLVDDCVKRGLLFAEGDGSLSFGHLTYQEYLVARYIDWKNDTSLVWEKLDSVWWRRCLEFFALLRMDISDVFHKNRDAVMNHDQWEMLLHMKQLAGLTPVETVREFVKRRREPFLERARML